jgi:hypothetical protein
MAAAAAASMARRIDWAVLSWVEQAARRRHGRSADKPLRGSGVWFRSARGDGTMGFYLGPPVKKSYTSWPLNKYFLHIFLDFLRFTGVMR